MSRAAALLALALLGGWGACDPVPAPVADAGPAPDDASAPEPPPLRVMQIGAAAFNVDSGFARLSQLGYMQMLGAAIAYAPVPLPAGDVLETVTVHYLHGDGAGAVRPGVRKMDPTSGVISPIWFGGTDVDGLAIESQSVDLNLTMPAAEVVWVEVTMTLQAARLYGATLHYREAP